MSTPLRVALIQQADARDVRSWSGTLHFSKQALARHLGPVVDLSPAPGHPLPLRLARGVVRATTGKWYSPDHDPALARYYGRYFTRRVAQTEADVIFAPAASGCVAFLETQIPVIYYSDATWRVFQDYYPRATNVVGRTRRGGEELESRAIERATLALFSSDWAAESAVRDYGADPAKVHTVYIGANIRQVPPRAQVLPRRLGDKLRLLMVGVSWSRKGGQIAYETLLHLVDLGYDAVLTVVGCTPPRGLKHPRMEVVPFLDKSIPAQFEQWERTWLEADFFLLPARFEAAGVVFCEASAYALPSIAARTGGVSSLVVDDKNGYTLPVEAGGAEYAATIAELINDPDRYSRLCESSREEFERRLNWDRWGERVAELLGDRLPHLRGRIPSLVSK
jgi:glycosyltransferase involved in cell wall biosynthesis